MPANRFGINLAEVYQNAESLKGQRTKNKLASLQLSEVERGIAERPEKERLAKEHQNKLLSLRTKGASGDTEAQQQLLAIDPEGGAKFIDAVAKMDERQKEKVKQAVDEIGRMSVMVLRSKNPEETYATMRSNVSPEAQSKLPEQYDPSFMEISLSKATAMDKLLEVKSVKLGGEDILFKGGIETERAERPTKSTGDKSGLTPSQSLAIEKFEYAKGKDQKTALYRAFAGLAKAKISPDGSMVLFNKNQSKWNQALTRATRLLTKGDVTDIEEAALKAAEAYGLATSTDGVRRFNASTGKIE